MLNLAQNVQTLRLESGLTQKQLAGRSGVTQANISKIEKGLQDPTVSTLVCLCAALGVSPADIFDRDQVRLSFSRQEGENIAAWALGKPVRLSGEPRAIAEALRDALPSKGRQTRKRAERGWATLRRRLGVEELASLLSRVEDARVRG